VPQRAPACAFFGRRFILSERHLSQVLEEYCFRYFNTARPHQGIGQRVPTARLLKGRTDPAGVIAVPVLGGLYHDYRKRCVTPRMGVVASTAHVARSTARGSAPRLVALLPAPHLPSCLRAALRSSEASPAAFLPEAISSPRHITTALPRHPPHIFPGRCQASCATSFLHGLPWSRHFLGCISAEIIPGFDETGFRTLRVSRSSAVVDRALECRALGDVTPRRPARSAVRDIF